MNFGHSLKMCILIFDLLPLILNNGTVNGEMPMVMKFGPSD